MSSSALFSNHGHVLLCLADDPEARLRDVAARIGITERAVQKIVRDLQVDGLISVTKHGRRNRYRINSRKSLQVPLDVQRTVGQLLALMRGDPKPEPVKDEAPAAPVAVVEKPTEPRPVEKARPEEPERPAAKPEPKPRKKGPPDEQQGSLF